MITKYAIRLSFTCLVLCGAGALASESYFQQTLPRKPDEKTGHVILRNVHGAYVYYTQEELWISRGLFNGMFVFGLIGGLLQVREARLRRN